MISREIFIKPCFAFTAGRGFSIPILVSNQFHQKLTKYLAMPVVDVLLVSKSMQIAGKSEV